jgi:hypothetical protein
LKRDIFGATVLLAMLAVACGGNDNAGSTTTATATASATSATTATATATATASATANASTGNATQLTSTKFDPKVALSAPGWAVTEDVATAFEIQSQTDALALIWFEKVAEVQNPTTLKTEAAPADLARWLRSHPSLTVTAEQPVTLDGFSGTQLDVTATASHPFDLFVQSQGNVGLDAHDVARFFVMETNVGQFVILIGTDVPSKIDSVYARAEPVLQSVQFN